MKKIDLGQTIGILANLGVLVGIVLLVVELRQNNQMAMEEAEYSNLVESLRMNEIVIQEEMAPLYYRSLADSPLSPLDQQRRSTLIGGMFEQWQWVFVRRRDEIPAEVFRASFRRAQASDIWKERRTEYSPEFVEWMEEYVVE